MEVGENSKRIKIDDNKADVYFGPESQTDLVLKVEEKRFHVSKLVLSLASPVFRRMFESDFKERSCKVLPLPGKRADSMLELLRCIYPDTLSPVTTDNALMILPLVDEYQMLHLKPRCEQALIGSIDDNTSTVELFQLLNKANNYDLKQMRDKCVKLASNKTKAEIDDARKQEQLPAEDLMTILDNLNTQLDNLNAKLASSLQNMDRLGALQPLARCLSGLPIKPSEHLKLESCLQWTGKPSVCNISTGARSTCEETLCVGDIDIYLKLKCSYTELEATVKGKEKTGKTYVERFIITFFVIIDKTVRGKHRCVQDIQKFKSNHTSTKTLISLADLTDEKNGFVKNSNASVVAFIFVSEPI